MLWNPIWLHMALLLGIIMSKYERICIDMCVCVGWDKEFYLASSFKTVKDWCNMTIESINWKRLYWRKYTISFGRIVPSLGMGSTINKTKDKDKKNDQPDSICSGLLAGNILKFIEVSKEKARQSWVSSSRKRMGKR